MQRGTSSRNHLHVPRYTSVMKCESSSETDSSTQSCVYKLPKRNHLSPLSDCWELTTALCRLHVDLKTKSTGKGSRILDMLCFALDNVQCPSISSL
ncbi:hypothetical protein NFI96_031493 [Prochilodus magdalenae]|nr:hypothetical protein NFI96_031493 [Prochilodus magdalenae]